MGALFTHMYEHDEKDTQGHVDPGRGLIYYNHILYIISPVSALFLNCTL